MKQPLNMKVMVPIVPAIFRAHTRISHYGRPHGWCLGVHPIHYIPRLLTDRFSDGDPRNNEALLGNLRRLEMSGDIPGTPNNQF